MVNQKKHNEVSKLSALIEKKPNFLLFKFEKTTHISLEHLRRELKKTNAGVRVIKNTLFQKTIHKISHSEPVFEEVRKKMFPLRENSAIVTMPQEYTPSLKSFYDFMIKDKTVIFKFGVLDKAVYLSDALIKIAKLPGKKEIITKIIGSFKSPMSRTVYALPYATKKLVYILKEKSKKAK